LSTAAAVLERCDRLGEVSEEPDRLVRVAMAAVTPVAMLFVRCASGISHNPAESVEEAGVAVALDVLERFVGDLA
jgi:acetylornithine deacetylase/succinyl-diaminopimelate desuccinylase-like protein